MTMRALEHKLPPPIVALLLGAAMWAVARGAAPVPVQAGLRYGIAGALGVLGFGVAGAGELAFRRAKTTANPMRPQAASALVTRGVYRFSRNPMYAGVAALLLGWAAWLAVPWALLGPVGFIAFITRFQIIPEERALQSKFGPEYADYLKRVGRWL
jgi:protein-S-isoprenylcysteine O-methyltransferase Ste14